ncbi:MAG: T9SS type A sorting domain-containing protein [Bacteroidetes bacterium]|nr:T9SS type A sorting domain-containing protein [Bacteroidota bacterium]
MKKIATIALVVSLFSVHSMGLLAQHVKEKNNYSETQGQEFRLTARDSIFAMDIPELKLPDNYKERDRRDLPPSLNNAELPYFRPIFTQEYYPNCGQSAGIGYNFTYEINRARGLPANIESNQYTPQFTWNFMNGGEGWYGVSYFHSFEVLKKVGNPSIEDYGGMYNGGNRWWMSGYEAYRNSMHNRIEEVYFIDVSTAEGIETLKYWIYDHLEGAEIGGVASFYAASPYNMKSLPENSPEAGKTVVTEWFYPATHAMTIVGYNDSIRYDYNNDGQFTNHIDINDDGSVDAKDWEIGGFLFANSHGVAWADSGFCYLMYNSLAQAFGEGGIWNRSVHVLKVKPDYQPLIGLKIKLKHNSRNKIKVIAGVSSDTSHTYPTKLIDFPIFNFQGGNHTLQGVDTISNADELELVLDMTPLLGEVDPGNYAKYFVQIVEKDPDDVGSGEILHAAIFDFNNEQETVILNTPKSILNNSITSVSGVAQTQFEKVYIQTEALPAVEPDLPYSFQFEAADGLPPYTWSLLTDYQISLNEATFPVNDGEEIVFSNNNTDAVMFDLPFSFPFYGDTMHQIYIHIDGFVTFENTSLPYPYFIGESTMLTEHKMIATFLTDLQLKPQEGHQVMVKSEQDYVLINWKTTHAEYENELPFIFALKLLPTGEIITYYNCTEVSDNIIWTSGISKGDMVNYVLNNALNYETDLTGKSCSYTSFSTGENMLSLTSNGEFEAEIKNNESISQFRVAVTDRQEITDVKQFQLSTGLLLMYEIQSGDDDKMDAGEVAAIHVSVKNISSQTLENVMLSYDMDDPYILPLDEQLIVGTLLAGETKVIDSSLVMKIENLIPDQHLLELRCSMNSSQKNWYLNTSITANAPVLHVNNIFWNGDDWIEPGLSKNILLQIDNSGHSIANTIEARFVCESGKIEVDGSNTMDINGLRPNENTVVNFKIKADAMVSPGSIIPCILQFYKEDALIEQSDFVIQVGQNSVLLIDMDPNHVSLSKVQNDLEKLDLVYTTSTHVPDDLSKHKSVFVFLGTYYSNHEITYNEGLKLNEYLNNGGNIYMEGRVTWTQSPSPVHEAFNIDISGNQFFIIDSVYTSQNDTTAQQSLFFNHAEPYCNYYFLSQDGAFPILNFTRNDSACVVANMSSNYKTIASIIEYGSLKSADTSYKAEDYLHFITDFFGLYESSVGIDEYYETSKENIFITTFPNPFTDHIIIQFRLPEPGPNLLQVFNNFGQMMYTKRLPSDMEKDRVYELEWNGRDSYGNEVNSGMYYIKIISGNSSSIAKVIRL